VASSAESFTCGAQDLAQSYLNAAQSNYRVLVLRGQFYPDGSALTMYQSAMPAPFLVGKVDDRCVWTGGFMGYSLGENYFVTDFDAPATFDTSARGPEVEDCAQDFPSNSIILFHYTDIGDPPYDNTVEIYDSAICGDDYYPATPANIRIIMQCRRGERCVGNY